MKAGALGILGVARGLLGLYQTFVLVGILCALSGGDYDYATSGFVWFLITCIGQLAIVGLAAMFGGEGN